MRGTSSASLREVVDRAGATLRSSDAPLEQVARELFSALGVIDSSNRLVRLLSDGGMPVDVRRRAVESLFGGKVAPATLAIIEDVVSHRWSEQEDVLDALERVGVLTLLDRAEQEGRLAEVEEQLFSISQLIGTTPSLSQAFDDARERPEERAELVRRLVGGKVDPITLELAVQGVSRRSDTKPSRRVLELAEIASERRRRLLAIVTSSRPLSEAQRDRLGAILDGIYGRAVQLNVATDPHLVGGLRIQVGDDLYDATVLSRLHQARERLAS